MKKSHYTIILFFIGSISLWAQDKEELNTFKIVKYKGKIDKYPITLLLTFRSSTNISGYYYYDNIGKFITISLSEKDRNTLVATKFEAYDLNHPLSENQDIPKEYEYLKFTDSLFIEKESIQAQWIFDGKTLPVSLEKDTTMPNWSLLNTENFAYTQVCWDSLKNCYLTIHSRMTESRIYPSIQTSSVLNRFFLQAVDNRLRDYINSNESAVFTISSNRGMIAKEESDVWMESLQQELVFYSDSILTYKTQSFTYSNNGYSSESYISIRVSDGEQVRLFNIFEEEYIDTVFAILHNKYKRILRNDKQEAENISDAPYYKSYGRKTEIFLAPKGIYFRERLYKLAPYYDLFLSYQEIKDFMKESFKQVINFED